MNINITVDHDKVTIEGITIARPIRMSPSQWQDFWNDAIRAEDDANDNTAKIEKLEELLQVEKDNVSNRDMEIKEFKERLSDIKTLVDGLVTA